MTELTNEQIWELRFNEAIKRFGSFDECMEIPGYGLDPEPEPEPEHTEFQQSLKLRFEACKQRYRGMEEHMEIPDMDLWLNLKNEIIPRKLKLKRQVCKTYYTNDITEEELKQMGLTTLFDHLNDDNDDDDYDNYSIDSEYRLERKQDKFFCGKRGRNAEKLER